ncbi:MAG: hypothetical protein RIC80_00670 [Cyclobacteriaceae bacterium]
MNNRKVNVIIYESSSFGGCYNYAIELQKAYRRDQRVATCELILPRNASVKLDGVTKTLVSDQPRIFTKLHFLWRQLANPIRFFIYARRLPGSLILFNDFEQLTSFLWVGLFRRFAPQHHYAVFLHDPDRDAYPPSKMISAWCMRHMMTLMQFGLYHDVLPEKSYYRHGTTKYLNVPHGIYDLPEPDNALLASLTEKKSNANLMLILGAIRSEKNYRLAISLLPAMGSLKLLIAGQPAHSGESSDELIAYATELGVADRVIQIDRFLTFAEMSACIAVTDVVWLNYQRSFKSQSAIFNTISPYQKKVIISKGDSAMAQKAAQFGIGKLVTPDDFDAAHQGLNELLEAPAADWSGYLDYASWDHQVNQVITALNKPED